MVLCEHLKARDAELFDSQLLSSETLANQIKH
jgi:hypothetical protein